MVCPQIWLIGGTSESAAIAQALHEQKLPYIVTVTTESARMLYPPSAQVQVGKMTPAAMADFVEYQNIVGILDASHPFACEISRQAIALTQQPNLHNFHCTSPAQSLSYLRYERSDVSQTDVSQTKIEHNKALSGSSVTGLVTTVQSIKALLESGLLEHQRVLLSLGCRDLYRFSPLRQTSQLFARILPSVDAIAQAQLAGFAPHELIALRPPISAALEKALWQQWNISKVVAKASGHPGGEATKRQVAEELGVGLILLQRPTLRYPQQTNALSTAVQFCAQRLQSHSS
jgi:precorrin-6A/cobalt-precorrin-6A reductase